MTEYGMQTYDPSLLTLENICTNILVKLPSAAPFGAANSPSVFFGAKRQNRSEQPRLLRILTGEVMADYDHGLIGKLPRVILL